MFLEKLSTVVFDVYPRHLVRIQKLAIKEFYIPKTKNTFAFVISWQLSL